MSSYSIFNTTEPVQGRTTEGVAVADTDTVYSSKISGKHADGIGLHLEWTGDPTGTVTFWVSDKPKPDETDDGDWVQDSTNFTAVNPAGSASKAQHNIAMRHAWARIKYVNSSGSGVLLGYVNISRRA